ncbi:MAG: MFS transporter [Acidimicrobiales bacterium]
MRGDDGILAPAWQALTIGLFLTIFVAAIEALSVAAVMPLVEQDLRDLTLYGWVFSAFFLGQLVGISLVARLIDTGPVRVPLALGLIVFAAGLVVASVAPSMGVLVGARVLQGIGAGAIPAVAFAVIGRAYPDELRPAMFAVVSTAWVVPAVFGPALAGFVGAHVGWRWVFAGLLPFVALAGTLAVRAVRVVPPPTTPAAARGDDAGDVPEVTATAPSRPDRRIPLTLGLTAAATVTLAGASLDGVAGAAMLVGGLVGTMWAFSRLTPRGTLRLARGVPAGVALKGLLVVAFFSADAFVPYAMVEGRGTEVWAGSLVITTVSLMWTVGSWIQARAVLRVGPVALCRVGFGCLALALAGMAITMAASVPAAVAFLAWGLGGIGIGTVYGAVTGSVLATAPVGDEGATSASLQLSETLGIALGTGAAGAVVSGLVERGATPAAAVAVVFVAAAVVALVGLVVAGRSPASVRRAAEPARPVTA